MKKRNMKWLVTFCMVLSIMLSLLPSVSPDGAGTPDLNSHGTLIVNGSQISCISQQGGQISVYDGCIGLLYASGGTDCPLSGFRDTPVSAWYHDGVHYCLEQGIMAGMGGDVFSPDTSASRGMIAAILWRLEAEPVPGRTNAFTDVKTGDWHADAINWAAENGIVHGYGNGCFGPDDKITREQMSVMLHHYAQYKGEAAVFASDLENFADREEISSYALTAMKWAVSAGLISGISQTSLNPGGTATRAQAATIFMQYCEK